MSTQKSFRTPQKVYAKNPKKSKKFKRKKIEISRKNLKKIWKIPENPDFFQFSDLNLRTPKYRVVNPRRNQPIRLNFTFEFMKIYFYLSISRLNEYWLVLSIAFFPPFIIILEIVLIHTVSRFQHSVYNSLMKISLMATGNFTYHQPKNLLDS